MKLREFLKVYNFREIWGENGEHIYTTQIIRIKLGLDEYKDDWIELGVNDWEERKIETIEYSLRPELLDRDIASFQYDDVQEKICIELKWTTTEEER